MSKFSEVVLREADAARVRAIREREAGRVNRDFAPIRRRAKANADEALRPARQGEMRVALA